MAEDPNDKQGLLPLSERLQNCLGEIQSLVRQGVEHARFEFKRAASPTREDLDDRLDFIKFVQGVANSEVSEERFVVIGADPTEKQFYSVTNATDFDPARLSPILAKYLDPIPSIEVFNNLQTDDGHRLVVLIFSAIQPQPIMVITEGQKVDGKTRLQVGDIWIKKSTSLRRASRSDIDLMYQQRMEEEAEDRARKRFKHFTEISGPTQLSGPIPPRLPARELLVSPSADFRRFVEELIAASDQARFFMFIELIRESIVEGWDRHDVRQPLTQNPQEYAVIINDFVRDEFLPSLQSLVSIALLVIKHNFQAEWLRSVVDLLVEAFEESHTLQRLKWGNLSQFPDALRWWRPAFEIYIALRCIAIYAVMRGRPRFLSIILQRFVVPISIDNRQKPKTPVLFWPLPAQMFQAGELTQGRSSFFGKERISSSWGSYFGTYDKFLAAACQLEFLLEFNSHLGTNSIHDTDLQKWLDSNAEDTSFHYVPDLFSSSLELTGPMAERCYDLILSQDASTPSSFRSSSPAFCSRLQKQDPSTAPPAIRGISRQHENLAVPNDDAGV